MLGNYSHDQLIVTVATLLGAFGGFPEAPKVFTEITKHEIVQWALVFVLLFQGGAGQDVKLAAMMTAVAYGFTKFLKSRE